MHYRNGRAAFNGDEVVQFGSSDGKAVACGTLVRATPGNDFCNGVIVVWHPNGTTSMIVGACLSDCLHRDDVESMLAEKGLSVRPSKK